MCLVFFLNFQHWAPKTLGISCDEINKDAFCYVNEVTFGKPLGNLRMRGWLPGEPTVWLEDWNFPSHPSVLWGEERGWRVNRLPKANDLINHEYVMKSPWKHKRTGFKELLSWWTQGDLGRVGLGEGTEVPWPFPLPCPMHLFPLAVPELYPFIINQ